MTFRFYIGGYDGGHAEIFLHKDDLYFFISRFSEGAPPDIPPDYVFPIKDDEGWKDLVEFIKTLHWKEKYFDKDILDGQQWALAFESEDKKLDCSGSNEYPAGFDEFIKRVNAMARKHKIPFEAQRSF